MAKSAGIGNSDSFLRAVRESRVAGEEKIQPVFESGPSSPSEVAARLVEKGVLNPWQAEYLLSGQPSLRLGNFLLTGRAGMDSLGERFTAVQESLHRIVELQVLPAELTANAEGMNRFLASARQLTQLNHPAILHLYDVADHKGRLFLVSEHCDPVNEAGFRELPEAGLLHLRAVRDLCHGLSYLHDQGLHHGLLDAPASLRLTRSGTAKIDQLPWSLLQREMISHSLLGTPRDRELADWQGLAKYTARLIGSAEVDQALSAINRDALSSAFASFANSPNPGERARVISGRISDLIDRIEKRPMPGTAAAAGAEGEAARPRLAEKPCPAANPIAAPSALNSEASRDTRARESRAAPSAAPPQKKLHPSASKPSSVSKKAGRFSRASVLSLVSLTILSAVVGWFAWNRWNGPSTTASRTRDKEPSARTRRTETPSGTSRDPVEASSKGSAADKRGGAGTEKGDTVTVTPTSRSETEQGSAGQTQVANAASTEASSRVSPVSPDVESAFATTAGAESGIALPAEGNPEALTMDPVVVPDLRESLITDPVRKVPTEPAPVAIPDKKESAGAAALTEGPVQETTPLNPAVPNPPDAGKIAGTELPKTEAAPPVEAPARLPKSFSLQTGTSQPQILGPSPGPDASLLTIAIDHDPETMGRGKNWFRVSSRGDRWEIAWSKKSAEEEFEPVAELFCDPSQQLVFQWKDSIDGKHPANCLVNSFLIAGTGTLSHRMALRDVVSFDGPVITAEKIEDRLNLDLGWLPKPEAVQIEFGELDGAVWTPQAELDQSTDEKTPNRIFLGNLPEERLVWLALNARVRNRLEIELAVQIAPGGSVVTPKPKELVAFFESFIANRNVMDAQVKQCEFLLIDPPYGTKGKREDALKAAKKQAEAATDLAKLAFSHQGWLQGVAGKSVPFRLLYPVEEHSIELARSSAWKDVAEEATVETEPSAEKSDKTANRRSR